MWARASLRVLIDPILLSREIAAYRGTFTLRRMNTRHAKITDWPKGSQRL
jgi:hypothetical protein